MDWSNSCPPNPLMVLYPKEPSVTWVGIKPVEAGLVNMGNTCYVNAAMQALAHLPGFIEFLEGDIIHRSKCFTLLNCVLCAVNRVMLNMSLHSTFKPSGLVHLLPKINPRFKLGTQDDSHEFMTCLLSAIEDQLVKRCEEQLDFCSKQTTAVGRIFGWWMETHDTCADCMRTKITYNPVSLLTAHLKSGSVQQAVNDYAGTVEAITDFSCTKDCHTRKCFRSFDYHTYPKVCRIVFNRFDAKGAKIGTPVTVDKSITIGKAVYSFSSGIIHEGDYCNEGHYTCLAVRSDGKVMCYNDSVVTEGNSEMNSTRTKCGIYVAIYQLHHFKPESIKRSPPTTPSRALSPLQKKQHVHSLKKSLEKKTKGKMLAFSPRKFKRKIGDIVKTILPSKAKKTDDVESLAKPLHEYLPDNQVSTIIAERRRSLVSGDPQSRFEPSDSASDTTATAIVSPIKISLNFEKEKKATVVARRRSLLFGPSASVYKKPAPPVLPEDSENVSKLPLKPTSHESEGTIDATVVPMDINNNQQTHKHIIRQESGTQTVSSEVTCGAKVTPIKISWRPRVNPKSSETQSNNEYMIQPTSQFKENKLLVDDDPQPMNHSPIGLDSVTNDSEPITLTAEDVPGGRLPKKKIQKNTVRQLKRWLYVRGFGNVTGKKKDLVAKVTDCIENGKDEIIDHEVDGGRWYILKQQKAKQLKMAVKEPGFANFDVDCSPGPAFVPLTLTADDVPDAHLPRKIIERNTKIVLQRWLELRDIPRGGNKKELVEKVKNCIAAGNDNKIDPKVDGGWWIDCKRQQLQSSQNFRNLTNDIFLTSGWSLFPSRDIPDNFNFGSVFYYLVETMPTLEVETRSDNSSGEEEEEELVTISDPFQDAECKEIKCSKKLRRGLQYVKSNYVQAVQDCLPDRVHVYRATVRASMRDKKYSVKVALSQVSGSVLKCICDTLCPQKSLGRCSHVSALLLFILLHKNLNGPKAITCTSRPNTWNKGSSNYEPGVVKEKQYDSFKINVPRRANFDPRATAYQTDHPTRRQINDFWCALSSKEAPSLFQSLLSIKYEDENEPEDILREKRTQMYDALQQQMEDLKPNPHFQGPFEVEETRSQSSTEKWLVIRALNCTAQPSHKIAHFQTENAKMNFLRNHLWGLDKVNTKGMTYGKINEPVARKKYAAEQAEIDPEAVVKECGLYLNTNFIGLSCSPDGIKTSPMDGDTLVEIKCLYSLRKEDPNNFDQVLTQKKLNSFCLQRKSNGDIILKSNHPYYDQVQFSMGLLELTKCDFVVWTRVNFVTVHVKFDEERWFELKDKLMTFHKEYLVPEYFAKKTPRQLHPQRLEE